MKVGLLVIATNKYIRFVDTLWESARKFFLVDHDVFLFVFTDSEKVPRGAIRVFQEHLPWPGTTLKRYNIFSANEAMLTKMDYLYYSDADMRFEAPVGNEVLGDLIATQHPGFYDKTYEFFSQSYEDRPESNAYMPPGMGKAYYAGGFNGGRKYMEMAKTISKWVNDDEERGIVAKWHDESYMNRYMAEHQPDVILSPAYCYQEEKNMPFPRKLVALKKDHQEMRA